MALCLLAWTLPPPARGQGDDVSEAAVKAVLLFKLPKFVYLLGIDKTRGIRFCVLGDDPLGRTLEKLARTTTATPAPQVRQLLNPSRGEDCDFLYLGRLESGNLKATLRQLADTPVVTVSDIEGFAQAGGMVEFASQGDGGGTQIVINRRAASRRAIEFNAQLLRLARIIEP